MQTNVHQTGRAHCDGALVHCARHQPEQTTLYRLVQQHAATFFAQAEDAAGADLPQFVKDEFDAFLECGILAHGFLRLRCWPSVARAGAFALVRCQAHVADGCPLGRPRHPAGAGASTRVFNGNPLLRCDGYYILCDLTEIPYLGQRANSGATGPRTW